MLIALSVPADNDRDPKYMEQALAVIHQAITGRTLIEFAFGCYCKTVILFCHFPPELAAVVMLQLAAHYPATMVQPQLVQDFFGCEKSRQ